MKTVTLGFLSNKRHNHLFKAHPWKLASLLAILCLSSIVGFSQELIEKHSYGVTSGAGNKDFVEFVDYDEEQGINLVGGIFSEVLNPNLNSSFTDESGNEFDEFEGFLALYDNNWNLMNHFILGSRVFCAVLTSDSTIAIGGTHESAADLDPRSNEEYLVSGPSWGNGFIGHYKFTGEPLWIKTFETQMVSRIDYLSFDGVNIFALLDCPNNSSGPLLFDDGESDLELSFENRGVAVLNFTLEGNLVWHEEYTSTSPLRGIGLEYKEGFLFIGLIVNDETELIMSESQIDNPLNLEHKDHVVLLKYDLFGRLVAEHWIVASDLDGDINGAKFTLQNEGVLVSFNTSTQTESIASSSQWEVETVMSNLDGLGQNLTIAKFNEHGLVSWVRHHTSTNVINPNGGASVDRGQSVWQTAYHLEDVLLSNGNVALNPLQEVAGLIIQYKPNGELFSANQLLPTSNSSVFSIYDFSTEEQLIIGGRYVGNHFMEWNQESGALGNSIGEENGFIAVYSLPEVEKSVLYNNVFSASEASEDGEVASVDFYVLGELEESVTLTLLPNPQLDLGNGQGIPIELTVSNEQEAFFSLEVFAVDDELVEGDHWGVIEVFIDSDDPAFDSLEDLYIQVDIDDNEPVNIAKVDQPTFQIYPNPANDQIRVDGDLITENEQYQVVNTSGQIVQEGRLENQNIDTSALPGGVYYIKLGSSMMNSFIKLVE